MKKFLSITLAILMIVTTIPFAFAAERTLTIEMKDNFGDGWNNAAIEILKIVRKYSISLIHYKINCK